ncbi:MAG TPA: hypothetical protein VMS38_10645, partial [Pseudorhodoferax sp.]|nr:hypothetical protein [Pseudorhodoferax sp.]
MRTTHSLLRHTSASPDVHNKVGKKPSPRRQQGNIMGCLRNDLGIAAQGALLAFGHRAPNCLLRQE